MNLYVGNLHYSVDEADLKELFEKFGSIKSIKVIFDQVAQRNRGYAFVEMESAESGMAAINELNDTQFKGRNMKVNAGRVRNY